MKSNQLIFGFLGVAVLLFIGAIAYKFAHHGPGKTAVQPASPGAVTAPVTATAPQAPPAPTAPATTVKPVKDALKAGVLNPIFFVQTKMQMLKRGLTAALNQRKITLVDLDKLSFDPGASTDPYNVFNPNGQIRYSPMDGVWLDQDIIDKLTTKKGTPLVFNMRRVTDKQGTSETLYAVIPNIAPTSCGVGAGNAEFTTRAALDVEPNNHAIIDDPAGMPIIDAAGCVHMSDGRILWLYNLKTRYQHKGETRWGSR